MNLEGNGDISKRVCVVLRRSAVMADTADGGCPGFLPQQWRARFCRVCFRPVEEHEVVEQVAKPEVEVARPRRFVTPRQMAGSGDAAVVGDGLIVGQHVVESEPVENKDMDKVDEAVDVSDDAVEDRTDAAEHVPVSSEQPPEDEPLFSAHEPTQEHVSPIDEPTPVPISPIQEVSPDDIPTSSHDPDPTPDDEAITSSDPEPTPQDDSSTLQHIIPEPFIPESTFDINDADDADDTAGPPPPPPPPPLPTPAPTPSLRTPFHPDEAALQAALSRMVPPPPSLPTASPSPFRHPLGMDAAEVLAMARSIQRNRGVTLTNEERVRAINEIEMFRQQVRLGVVCFDWVVGLIVY